MWNALAVMLPSLLIQTGFPPANDTARFPLDRRWWNAFCRVARELLDEHQPGVTVELIRETFRPTDAPAFIEELQRQFLRRQHRDGDGSHPAG